MDNANSAAGVTQPQPLSPSNSRAWAANLQGGLGYRDNLLYADQGKEGAAFLRGAAEFNLKSREWPVTVFASAEEKHYLGNAVVDDEQFLELETTYALSLNDPWQAAISGVYSFDHHVEDTSDTEQVGTVKVRGHELTLRGELERDLRRGWSVGIEPVVTRQLWQTPLDDYWQPGGVLRADWRDANGGKLTLSYGLKYRAYDTRNQIALNGVAIPDTDLTYCLQEATGQWRQYLDSARHWQGRVRIRGAWNADNGTGYFDYQKYQLAGQLNYTGHQLKLATEVRLSRTSYSNQSTNPGGADRWKRTQCSGATSVGWQLTPDWQINAEYELEWADSNRQRDDYLVNTVTLGLQYSF